MKKQIKRGNQVTVKTNTYQAKGIVVAVFKKAFSDNYRCVVEYVEPEGLLHIHSLDQCTVIGKEKLK